MKDQPANLQKDSTSEINRGPDMNNPNNYRIRDVPLKIHDKASSSNVTTAKAK